MRLFNKQMFEVKSFKKRFQFCDNFNKNLFFFYKNRFACSFFTKREMRVESIYFNFFKKVIKKISKQSKINFFFNKKNVWIFWKPNYPLTKKSKNSRMGKGKGVFLRWSFRVGSSFCLFKIRHCSHFYRIKLAKTYLNYKLNNNIFVF